MSFRELPPGCSCGGSSQGLPMPCLFQGETMAPRPQVCSLVSQVTCWSRCLTHFRADREQHCSSDQAVFRLWVSLGEKGLQQHPFASAFFVNPGPTGPSCIPADGAFGFHSVPAPRRGLEAGDVSAILIPNWTELVNQPAWCPVSPPSPPPRLLSVGKESCSPICLFRGLTSAEKGWSQLGLCSSPQGSGVLGT